MIISSLFQAMDRAHRLGQKKVVHVHRLIMRGTLEEKVMSLQRFKVSVANAVINAENASLKTMNTDQLLDLFTPADAKKVHHINFHLYPVRLKYAMGLHISSFTLVLHFFSGSKCIPEL